MNRLPIKFISLLLLIALNGSMLLTVGETFGFFSDVEKSENTTFEIGVLDFSLNSADNFSPDLKPTELTSSRTVNLSEDGTLGFKYKIKVENAVGGLCSSLKLKDDLTNTYQALSSFISGETTSSATPSLIFTSNSSSYDESLQGEICNFNLVFEAWQENLIDNTQGFTDIETINSTVKMGYWDSDIVMNEFLPNADNYDEFIEFYNKGVSAIEMDGYYVMADTNRIDVNSINTNAYSLGLTTIDPDNWLVITTGGGMLNDISGTLTLYNSNGVEMDSYTYDGADHNINNNPGGTNDLVAYLPFDGDLLDISENHNDGTSHGTAFTSGRINQAVSFDGIDDYIEVADSISLDIADAITLEAWVYPEFWNNSYENSILTKAGDKDWGVWNLHYKTKTSGFRFEMNNGSGQALFELTPSTALDRWYHIVSTYDNSSMKLYIDGSLSNSKPTSGSIITNDAPLRIGKQFWSGSVYSYWDGLIDEVKIYNRALDADEVLEHYNDVGVLGAVPVDKSYARIPDGIGIWVDPMPTPGTPNRLSVNETQITNVVEEEMEILPPVVESEESSPATTTTDVIITDTIAITTVNIATTTADSVANTTEEIASSTETEIINTDIEIASSTKDIISTEIVVEEEIIDEEGEVDVETELIIDPESELAPNPEPIKQLIEQIVEPEPVEQEDVIIDESVAVADEPEATINNQEDEDNQEENE